MKLDIYEKKKIVKTYNADTYDLMFGTMEDIVAAAKLDDMESADNTEIIHKASEFVTNSLDQVKDLLKDIFEGLTDEELRNTKVCDLIAVIVDVLRYTFSQIGKHAKKSKN